MNVLLNYCKQNSTLLLLLVGTTVPICILVFIYYNVKIKCVCMSGLRLESVGSGS